MHTIHGVFASLEEGLKGTLEVRKATDLVILAEDLRRVLVERVRHVGTAMTEGGGEVIDEG